MRSFIVIFTILQFIILTGCTSRVFYDVNEEEKFKIGIERDKNSLNGLYLINNYTAAKTISWLMQYDIRKLKLDFKVLFVTDEKNGRIEMVLFDKDDNSITSFSRNVVFENDYWIIKFPPLEVFTLDYIFEKTIYHEYRLMPTKDSYLRIENHINAPLWILFIPFLGDSFESCYLKKVKNNKNL